MFFIYYKIPNAGYSKHKLWNRFKKRPDGAFFKSKIIADKKLLSIPRGLFY